VSNLMSPAVLMMGCTLLIGAASTPVRADDNACMGTVQAPPPGLVEAQDPALLAKALGAPQQGKLCSGKVFVATQPGARVTVYRVWDASKSYTALGSWWSFDAPQGPRDAYRRANEICPAWSALNKASRCTIKPGTEIVVGPGQSAQCDASLSYPPSAVNQVYIANDAQHGQVQVDQCEDLGEWPSAAP